MESGGGCVPFLSRPPWHPRRASFPMTEAGALGTLQHPGLWGVSFHLFLPLGLLEKRQQRIPISDTFWNTFLEENKPPRSPPGPAQKEYETSLAEALSPAPSLPRGLCCLHRDFPPLDLGSAGGAKPLSPAPVSILDLLCRERGAGLEGRHPSPSWAGARWCHDPLQPRLGLLLGSTRPRVRS
ncbi:UNVERIFIED_CONTAM: hypothetical protein K2H54_003033 [Gekko kuhli]